MQNTDFQGKKGKKNYEDKKYYFQFDSYRFSEALDGRVGAYVLFDGVVDFLDRVGLV